MIIPNQFNQNSKKCVQKVESTHFWRKTEHSCRDSLSSLSAALADNYKTRRNYSFHLNYRPGTIALGNVVNFSISNP